MIGLFIFFCCTLVIGALLHYVITQGSGYFLIVWGNTSIEMSLWFGVLAFIFSVFLTWFVLWVFFGGLKNLFKAKQSLTRNSHQKTQNKMTEGLANYIEGNWHVAHKLLVQSANKVDSPLINYLAAARSAYELGNKQEAMDLLHKAESSSDEKHLAVAITQARMQNADKQYEQALATLERAKEKNSQHPVVLTLLKQSYEALDDWESLKKLLPQLKRYTNLSKEHLHELEVKIHYKNLMKLSKDNAGKSQQEQINGWKQAWKKIPDACQYDTQTLSFYTQLLMSLDEHEEAERLLFIGLSRHWKTEWIQLFSQLKPQDIKRTLKRAETLLKTNKNADIYFALGKLHKFNKQWGQAEHYFKQSLELSAKPDTYAELAEVSIQLDKTTESESYYKQGLLSAIH